MIPQNTFTIFLGDAKTMNLKAIYEESLAPFDLTTCTEIDVPLPLADGTFDHLLLSDGDVAITSPAILGAFTVPIPSDVSLLLNIGELQNIDVTFTIGGLEQTVRFAQALSVFER